MCGPDMSLEPSLRGALEDDLFDAAFAYEQFYTMNVGEELHTLAMKLYTAAVAYKGYAERFDV